MACVQCQVGASSNRAVREAWRASRSRMRRRPRCAQLSCRSLPTPSAHTCRVRSGVCKDTAATPVCLPQPSPSVCLSQPHPSVCLPLPHSSHPCRGRRGPGHPSPRSCPCSQRAGRGRRAGTAARSGAPPRPPAGPGPRRRQSRWRTAAPRAACRPGEWRGRRRLRRLGRRLGRRSQGAGGWLGGNSGAAPRGCRGTAPRGVQQCRNRPVAPARASAGRSQAQDVALRSLRQYCSRGRSGYPTPTNTYLPTHLGQQLPGPGDGLALEVVTKGPVACRESNQKQFTPVSRLAACPAHSVPPTMPRPAAQLPLPQPSQAAASLASESPRASQTRCGCPCMPAAQPAGATHAKRSIAKKVVAAAFATHRHRQTAASALNTSSSRVYPQPTKHLKAGVVAAPLPTHR